MKFILCFSPIVDLVNTLLEETEINIFSQDFGVWIYSFIYAHTPSVFSLYLFICKNVIVMF